MFPTGNRGRAAGLLTTAALLGGIDRDPAGRRRCSTPAASYGGVIGIVALAQVVVVTVVLLSFPETAHLELEELNPEDAVPVGDRHPRRRTPLTSAAIRSSHA